MTDTQQQTSRISLTDDGTRDTVLRCDECGEEFRYTYQPDYQIDDEFPLTDAEAYDLWVDSCIEDAESEHECTGPGFTEPGEDDLTTEDHRTFYQYGRLAFSLEEVEGRFMMTVDPRTMREFPVKSPGLEWEAFNSVEHAIRAFMQASQFWPSVWVISDHGNAHRMEV